MIILKRMDIKCTAFIIEGFALGEKFESVQLPVTVYEGGNDVKFRMYEDGIQSLIQGGRNTFQ